MVQYSLFERPGPLANTPVSVRFHHPDPLPARTWPYTLTPGYYAPGGLWLYGNVKLLDAKLAYVADSLGPPIQIESALDEIERVAEEVVLDGRVLVCGVHNEAQQRVAVVPLRWGSPRIVVFSGGFERHLGKDLLEEPFRVGRLWRYQWDATTDLAISRRAPDKKPTFGHFNPTVDKLIELLATDRWPGLASTSDPVACPLRRSP